MGGRAMVDGRERWSYATKREVLLPFATVWSHLVIEDDLVRGGRPYDAIFCFGSRHWRVPQRAADLYRHGAADRVVVTGGPAAPGEETECDRFGRALVARGVPASAIVEEHRAVHTGENVRYGVDALRSVARADRLLLVSWPLAARRCRATFAALEPTVEVHNAPALRRPGWRWAPSARRARLAIGELERLDRYRRAELIVEEPTPSNVVDAAETLRSALSALPARSAHDPSSHRVEAPGSEVGAEHAALLD